MCIIIIKEMSKPVMYIKTLVILIESSVINDYIFRFDKLW